MTEDKKLKPLAIKCSTSDCDNNLHCFHKSQRLSADQKQNWKKGACVYCGSQTVDWDRVKKRDITDVSNTVQSLRNEWIRNHFWEEDLSQRVIDNACRKGKSGLVAAIEKRIRQSVSKPKSENPWDGRQTTFDKKKESIITRGQHAIACCCRKCIEHWHGIPSEAPLSEADIQYFRQLILMFIEAKLPDLQEAPKKIPRGEEQPSKQPELKFNDKDRP